jgi:hypothetical protein
MQMLRLLGDNNDNNDNDSIEAAEYAAFLSEINSNNNNNNSLEAIWSEIAFTNNHDSNDADEDDDGGPTANTTTRMVPISNFNYFDSPPTTATTGAHAITNEANNNIIYEEPCESSADVTLNLSYILQQHDTNHHNHLNNSYDSVTSPIDGRWNIPFNDNVNDDDTNEDDGSIHQNLNNYITTTTTTTTTTRMQRGVSCNNSSNCNIGFIPIIKLDDDDDNDDNEQLEQEWCNNDGNDCATTTSTILKSVQNVSPSLPLLLRRPIVTRREEMSLLYHTTDESGSSNSENDDDDDDECSSQLSSSHGCGDSGGLLVTKYNIGKEVESSNTCVEKENICPSKQIRQTQNEEEAHFD